MTDSQIHPTVEILRRITRKMMTPYVTDLATESHDPFLVLISTMLSLRTKDAVTMAASQRLFRLAASPRSMVRLRPAEIEKAIRPVGFYRTKAGNIHRVCRELIVAHGGRVPDNVEILDKLPGVGRKTANLVVTLGYGKPGICVDTHVHRIVNRWGYVRTKTPDETEKALRAKLPRRYWIEINTELVAFGQNICVPVSPFCSRCPLFAYCDRVGVTRSR